MRSIDISTEVFAKIWALRLQGEEDENAILMRLLGLKKPQESKAPGSKSTSPRKRSITKVLWCHDVRQALRNLGGQAHLREIYEEVRSIRRKAGRSLPINVEPIVRKELEHNSSDSHSYKAKRDWFKSVNGIRGGVWALREQSDPK